MNPGIGSLRRPAPGKYNRTGLSVQKIGVEQPGTKQVKTSQKATRRAVARLTFAMNWTLFRLIVALGKGGRTDRGLSPKRGRDGLAQRYPFSARETRAFSRTYRRAREAARRQKKTRRKIVASAYSLKIRFGISAAPSWRRGRLDALREDERDVWFRSAFHRFLGGAFPF